MISFNPLSVKALVLLTAATGVIANPVLKERAPSSCDLVRCASGTVCQVIDNVAQCVGGQKCGTAVCGAGLVCCNALCNICTKPGELCVQGCPVTDPVVDVATGPVCGSKTCASDEAPRQQLEPQLARSVVQTLAHRTRYAATRAAANAPNPVCLAPKKAASALSAVQTLAYSARYAATIAVAIAPSQAGNAPRNSAPRRLRLARLAARVSAELDRYAVTAAAGSALLRAANALNNSALRRLRPAQHAARMSAQPDRYAATAAAESALLRAVSTMASDIKTAEFAGQAADIE
ncbi:hypothetical protein V500_03451 [Pseudogymnoascus sp. VKM F-4518 (FW-2643)]|nr:hypothetical protein V500_03451 [Pseudogymnoascus sp. VKM F-4518 (FW-2643)]